MIICFSGTGNTRRLADKMQDLLGDELVRFAPGLMNTPSRIKQPVYDQRVIWMLPVHAWGMPKVVREIIQKAQIKSRTPVTHHLVITCGDDIGYADAEWRKLIAKRGWKIGCVFSVQMPNVYTFLPGFDIDSPQVAADKRQKADKRIEDIAEAIAEDSVVCEVTRGNMAWAKSHILRPLFRTFLWSAKPFHTNDKCVGCGKCVRNCPLTNIVMRDGRPKWGLRCTMCSRCYHACPNHAVEYGRFTKGKGQYLCPGYTINN